jgi:hypothetical protein
MMRRGTLASTVVDEARTDRLGADGGDGPGSPAAGTVAIMSREPREARRSGAGKPSARRRAFLAAAFSIAAGAAGAGVWASRSGVDEVVLDGEPPPPPEVLAQVTRDLDLPSSTTRAVDHAPCAVSVLVTRTALLVGGDPIPITRFPEGLAPGATGLSERVKRGGAGNVLVPELGNELEHFGAQSEARREEAAFALLANASTPYGVIAEVLSTAWATRFARMDVAVRTHDARLAWIAVPIERVVGAVGVWIGPAPALSITGEGFALRWGGDDPGPGCDPRTGGTVVPMLEGRYDARALDACLRRIKAEAPWEKRLVLRSRPGVRWQDVVSALDAAVASFSDVRFGNDADYAGEDWERFAAKDGGGARMAPPLGRGALPRAGHRDAASRF